MRPSYVSGYGGDITRFSLDPMTFAATKLGTTSGGASPSYLAIGA